MPAMSAPPILLGHRGCRGFANVPENTFAAFDLALAHGSNGFEFDVRLSGSGTAVVCHDARIGNVVVSRAKAQALREVPLLEQILCRYADRAFLDIELKVPGLELKVLSALRDHPPTRDYVVSSFLPAVLFELKVRSGTVPLGIICDQPSQASAWPKLPVDYVVAEKQLVTPQFITDIQSAGRKIFVWTVNDVASMQQLAEWGVDGVISDNTKLLVETLRPTNSPS